MEREDGSIPQREQSKFAAWQERRRFKKLKKDIHRLAKREEISVSIFNQSVCGHKRYDTEENKLSQINSKGNEVNVFDSFNQWAYLQQDLKEHIKTQGQEAKRLRKAVGF